MERKPGRIALVLLALALPACSEAAPPPAPPPAPVAVTPAQPPDPPPEPWETEKDPVKARTLKLETAWRLDPLFTGRELRFLDLRPALVAMETGVDPAVGEAAGNALGRLAVSLRELLREAGLDAPTLAELGDERIRLMIFKDRKSFEAWHVAGGFPDPGGPCYRRNDRLLIGWADALPPASVLEIGTFALRHFYSRYLCEAEDAASAAKSGQPPERVGWEDHRLYSSFHWFEHGMARWFGGLHATTGGTAAGETGGIQAEDRKRFLEARAANRLWHLEELLFRDSSQVRSHAAVAFREEELTYLAGVQGSLLVAYFMEGDGGRHRPAFLRVVRNEFSGVSAKPYPIEAFGLVDDRGRGLRSEDPKVQAWIREVEADLGAFVDAMK